LLQLEQNKSDQQIPARDKDLCVQVTERSDSDPLGSKLTMKKILGVVVMVLLTATAAVAQVQAGLGALAGVVEDKTHAAIPGATVTLDNPGIGLHMITKTNKAGEYKFSPLEVVGGYKITVEAKGFATEDIKDIKTSVGTIITQNALLAVGKQDTVVVVEAAAVEQVQTDTSSVSQLIDSTVWKDSPLETRSQNNFVGLVAGATVGNAGRGYSVNGARSGAGNFMVDGFDNNDQGLGGAGGANINGAAGGAVTTISPDAIEEFRVITDVAPAEYGRAGAFSTDTVLKSGTKKWHGSLFEYNRIQALAANDFFSNRAGLRDHLVRNQFGASLGGPIYKDKTFFFSTFEAQRFRQGAPITGTGTTQAFLNFVKLGAYKAFQEGTAQQNPGNTFTDSNGNQAIQEGTCPLNTGATCLGLFSSSATLGPVFTKLLASEPNALPLSSGPFTPNSNVAQGLFTSYGGNGAQDVLYPVPVYGPITGSSSTSANQYRATTKLDHKFSDKDQLSMTYLLDFVSTIYSQGGGGNTFGIPETNIEGSQNVGFSYTHIFSPSLLNVAKASYLRHVNNASAPGSTGVFEEATADSLSEGFGHSSGLPQYFTDADFTYEDAVTKTYKINTFKAGFRYVRTRNASQFYNDVDGTLFPWSVEGLATDGKSDEVQDNYFFGAPTYGGLYYASASVDPSAAPTYTLPNVYRGYRANEFSAYVQDDIKFSARLTVNAGVRWEYFGPPHNFIGGIDSNVYYGPATTATSNGNPFFPVNNLGTARIQGASFQLAQANGRSTIWNRDTNNFAPRLGFAYDTMGNGKFVLRGGFGIGYDRLYNNVYENIRFNSPHFADNTIGYGAGSATPASLTLFPGLYSDPFSPSAGNAALASHGGKPVPRHIDQNLVTAYYEQAHLGFESALPKGFVLEVNYIGTWGRKLVGLRDLNNYDGRTACLSSDPSAQRALCTAAGYTTTSTHSAFTSARPNAIFNSDNFRSNGFNSNYNSGQISIRKSYAYGLQLSANYTFAKSLDEASDVFSQASGITGQTDPLSAAYDYGPSDFDIRHTINVTANYVYKHDGKFSLLTSGWGVSPILQIQSGSPFTPYDSQSTYDPNRDGRPGIDRIVYTGGGSIKNAIVHKGSPAGDNNGHGGYFNIGAFKPDIAGTTQTCPVTQNAGLFCDPAAGRNSLYGPSYYNLNLGVLKHFYLARQQSVTFEANFFNIFNHPNFGNPVHDFNASSHVDTSNGQFIGQSSSDAGPRVTQLSLRYDF
jgi:hypothetical protein